MGPTGPLGITVVAPKANLGSQGPTTGPYHSSKGFTIRLRTILMGLLDLTVAQKANYELFGAEKGFTDTQKG